MNQFIIYDVRHYAWFEVISNNLRKSNPNVHDVAFKLSDMPVDDWDSTINQIWAAGISLSQLADMVNGGLITDGSEFVVNTDTHCLVEGINMLLESQNINFKITHWKQYK